MRLQWDTPEDAQRDYEAPEPPVLNEDGDEEPPEPVDDRTRWDVDGRDEPQRREQ